MALLYSRDTELPETSYGAITAPSANLSHPRPHALCTGLLSQSSRSMMTSLESPPASRSFEWDQRSGQTGGQKFVDGIARLTSDADGSGCTGMDTLGYTRFILDVYTGRHSQILGVSGANLSSITVGHNDHHSGTSSPRVCKIPFAITLCLL